MCEGAERGLLHFTVRTNSNMSSYWTKRQNTVQSKRTGCIFRMISLKWVVDAYHFIRAMLKGNGGAGSHLRSHPVKEAGEM